jgi:hypothetical protein
LSLADLCWSAPLPVRAGASAAIYCLARSSRAGERMQLRWLLHQHRAWSIRSVHSFWKALVSQSVILPINAIDASAFRRRRVSPAWASVQSPASQTRRSGVAEFTVADSGPALHHPASSSTAFSTASADAKCGSRPRGGAHEILARRGEAAEAST